MARVIHLFRAPRRRAPMEELPEAHAVEDVGLEGCAHSRPQGKRQVLLMDRETLDAFELTPGIVRENVTTEGLEVNALTIGQRLQVGGAELQVSAVCDPCEQIEALRPGLQAEMQGRRGMLCKVVRGGTLRRGDGIVVIQMAGK
ncbi:MAG TPA: MOSC domain-containing protein [Candidatus Limnocylindrales bacterium]|nr:MOSC domain-containing protein [Candidatus Limnocylindrales bacterium]